MWSSLGAAPAGRKSSCEPSSTRISSARLRRPATTSMRPPAASGANRRERDGLRRSASTSSTRLPAWAMRCAKLAEMVDLPSFGSVEVTPMT